MKISIDLLRSALAVFAAFPAMGMENKLEQEVKLLKDYEPSRGIAEHTSFELEKTTGSKKSVKDKRPSFFNMQTDSRVSETRLTPGALAIKYSGVFQNPKQSVEMYHFLSDAKEIILKPPRSTHSVFTNEMEHYLEIVNTALGIWEKADLWENGQEATFEKFRILGLLTEILKAVPWEPEAKEILMQQWPDRLKMELKATDEYAESMAVFLLKYAYHKTQEDAPRWSEVRECFSRSRKIGTYQKRVMESAPGQSEKQIDVIIKNYLMEPQLPKEEKEIEELIDKMRSNLREISADTFEGRISIDLLFHLSQYSSTLQNRLGELEKRPEFLKDTALPHARSSLDAVLKEGVQSIALKQEIARVKKLKIPPSDENLEFLIGNMKSSIESRDYKSAIQIYRLLTIDGLYHPDVDNKMYKLLFDGPHVPVYMAKLWSNMHPGLDIAKNVKYGTHKMIKDNPKYFLDAKRYILSLEMSKVECESLSRLSETLDSLTVQPHQTIQKDSFERICKQVLDSIESVTVDDDDIPKRYAMSIEAILRVLEYEPQSISYLLEYMDHNKYFREKFYLCSNHLIKVGHLIHKAAPQMLGFVTQMVKSYEDIWPLKFPVHRLNVYYKLEEEKPGKQAERIDKAIDSLKKVILESDQF